MRIFLTDETSLLKYSPYVHNGKIASMHKSNSLTNRRSISARRYKKIDLKLLSLGKFLSNLEYENISDGKDSSSSDFGKSLSPNIRQFVTFPLFFFKLEKN